MRLLDRLFGSALPALFNNKPPTGSQFKATSSTAPGEPPAGVVVVGSASATTQVVTSVPSRTVATDIYQHSWSNPTSTASSYSVDASSSVTSDRNDNILFPADDAVDSRFPLLAERFPAASADVDNNSCWIQSSSPGGGGDCSSTGCYWTSSTSPIKYRRVRGRPGAEQDDQDQDSEGENEQEEGIGEFTCSTPSLPRSRSLIRTNPWLAKSASAVSTAVVAAAPTSTPPGSAVNTPMSISSTSLTSGASTPVIVDRSPDLKPKSLAIGGGDQPEVPHRRRSGRPFDDDDDDDSEGYCSVTSLCTDYSGMTGSSFFAADETAMMMSAMQMSVDSLTSQQPPSSSLHPMATSGLSYFFDVDGFGANTASSVLPFGTDDMADSGSSSNNVAVDRLPVTSTTYPRGGNRAKFFGGRFSDSKPETVNSYRGDNNNKNNNNPTPAWTESKTEASGNTILTSGNTDVAEDESTLPKIGGHLLRGVLIDRKNVASGGLQDTDDDDELAQLLAIETDNTAPSDDDCEQNVKEEPFQMSTVLREMDKVKEEEEEADDGGSDVDDHRHHEQQQQQRGMRQIKSSLAVSVDRLRRDRVAVDEAFRRARSEERHRAHELSRLRRRVAEARRDVLLGTLRELSRELRGQCRRLQAAYDTLLAARWPQLHNLAEAASAGAL
jgi:hypothetical protein